MTLSVYRGLTRAYVWARRRAGVVLFDRRYGVVTDGPFRLAHLDISEPQSKDYMPAGLWSLRRILRPSEVGDEDVFVDFGSGKGRVVLQAALHYRFRRVYGVELSEHLHGIAERNIAQVRNRLGDREIILINANALDVSPPDDATVAFLFNPFTGVVFETVINRLLQSLDRNPRQMRIIYGNPCEEAALLKTGRVRLVRVVRGWRPSREWSRSNSYRMYEVQ